MFMKISRSCLHGCIAASFDDCATKNKGKEVVTDVLRERESTKAALLKPCQVTLCQGLVEDC